MARMASMPLNGVASSRRKTRSSDASSNDNIDVKPRHSARITLRASNSPEQPVESNTSDAKQKVAMEVQSPKGEGKAALDDDEPMQDASAQPEANDQDSSAPHDDVEEYDFANEPENLNETFEDGLDEDAYSVITLSSEQTTPDEPEYPIEDRPWLKFDVQKRQLWEKMYSSVTPFAIGGNWSVTEEYQREKDNEMLRYVEDFPIPQWVIPESQAMNAYFQLVERMRWRNFGIPIYGRDRVPLLQPDVGFGPPPSAGLPPSRNSHPPPPGPGPSQHIPQPLYGQHPAHSQPGASPLSSGMLPPVLPLHLSSQQVPLQQRPGPAPHPNRGQLPPGILPSQPYAQPISIQHGQRSPYSIPLGTYVGHPVCSPYVTPLPGAPPGPPLPKPARKPREKKQAAVTGTPPPPPPTPPYEIRVKPAEAGKTTKRPSRATNKPGKRAQRRQAEAEEFPWTRQINFSEAKKNIHWDDTIYDAATLNDMERTRRHNIHLIEHVDGRLQEMQRQARNAKKASTNDEEKVRQEGEQMAETERKPKERKRRGNAKTDNGDPYHSGCFSWADEASETLGRELGYEVPDDAIDAGKADKVSNEQMAKLKIYWNPGKKGGPQGLEQARFSVRDSVLTRKQLNNTPILNRRAAECIVDFCPDLLWRGLLLRVCSEGGYGNKDVRDRFCYNGCYCDKATITKRISAALGQKQVHPSGKGHVQAEMEWYEENVRDFTCYIEYFGRRTGHRNMLKIQIQSDKRRAALKEKAEAEAQSSPVPEEGVPGPSKRRKLHADGSHAVPKVEDAESGDEDEVEDDGAQDSDAVSLQNSDILDEMDGSD